MKFYPASLLAVLYFAPVFAGAFDIPKVPNPFRKDAAPASTAAPTPPSAAAAQTSPPTAMKTPEELAKDVHAAMAAMKGEDLDKSKKTIHSMLVASANNMRVARRVQETVYLSLQERLKVVDGSQQKLKLRESEYFGLVAGKELFDERTTVQDLHKASLNDLEGSTTSHKGILEWVKNQSAPKDTSGRARGLREIYPAFLDGVSAFTIVKNNCEKAYVADAVASQKTGEMLAQLKNTVTLQEVTFPALAISIEIGSAALLKKFEEERARLGSNPFMQPKLAVAYAAFKGKEALYAKMKAQVESSRKKLVDMQGFANEAKSMVDAIRERTGSVAAAHNAIIEQITSVAKGFRAELETMAQTDAALSEFLALEDKRSSASIEANKVTLIRPETATGQ
jgi:hypothetical protein